ncbi:MAG: hypothetical protein QOH65_1616 [Methylobacteriaceae bacterium]|nr:hypothetical protein [Methylobacteriaceae bacterium]
MRLDRATIHFLFQTYEGMIDRRTWRSGALVLAAILIPLTLIWIVIAPATHRDLSTPELLDARALGAFIYLAIFAFAVILIAVSWTNLSAKRFRDLGRPAVFATALPFAALLGGAAHWFQPRASDILPEWALIFVDVAIIAVALWSFYELGLAYPAASGGSNLPRQ